MVVVSYVLAFLAILAMIASFIYGSDYATKLTNCSTLISVILGVMSIVYSSRSNKSTDALLNDIRSEFENVVEDAQIRKSTANVNQENIDDVEEMIDRHNE